MSEVARSSDPRFQLPSGGVVEPKPPLQARKGLQTLLTFGYLCDQAKRWRIHGSQGDAQRALSSRGDVQLPIDEALHVISERALVVTGAEGIAVALPEGNAICCRVSAGAIALDLSACIDPHSGFSGACLRAGRTVRCDDAESDPRVNRLACPALGARSMVAVPLVAGQDVIGLLEAFSSQPHRFSIPDAFRLSVLGEIIVAAIMPEERLRMAAISHRLMAGDATGTGSSASR